MGGQGRLSAGEGGCGAIYEQLGGATSQSDIEPASGFLTGSAEVTEASIESMGERGDSMLASLLRL